MQVEGIADVKLTDGRKRKKGTQLNQTSKGQSQAAQHCLLSLSLTYSRKKERKKIMYDK